jgi:hypothetical protein
MQVFLMIFFIIYRYSNKKVDLLSVFTIICHMFDSLKKNADIYVSLEETDQPMTWCDDCGNYGIQKALFQALTLE